MPIITAMYTGLGALLVIGLTLNVVRLRRTHAVGIHDGGHDDLALAVRAHGNLVEYLALMMLLVAFVELWGAPTWAVHALGATAILGRSLHAFAMLQTSRAHVARTLGMVLTITVLMTTSGVAFYAVATQ